MLLKTHEMESLTSLVGVPAAAKLGQGRAMLGREVQEREVCCSEHGQEGQPLPYGDGKRRRNPRGVKVQG